MKLWPSLALVSILAAPTHAAPATNPAQLFERAAKIYGNAQSLSLDYRITSANQTAIPLDERGTILWSKPKLYAQSWTYSGGRGHVAADDKQIYSTDVDGKAARQNWSGDFGFWASLPWPIPGSLEQLLRGQKISLRGAVTRPLPSQKIEGILCDGALLDLRRVNGDTIRFWFARKTGLLMRESWAVRLPDSTQIVQVQTRYFHIRLNPKLERRDFVRADEENSPLLEQPSAINNGDAD